MRLRAGYREAIMNSVCSVFGNDATVSVFGSRIDDSKKGGDIDLYIKVIQSDNLFEKKIKFLAKLKRLVGNQRIDIVFNVDSSRLIEKEAEKWAITL